MAGSRHDTRQPRRCSAAWEQCGFAGGGIRGGLLWPACVLLVVAVSLGACSGRATPTAASIPTPTAATAPAPTAATEGGLIVTLADDGRTVTMRVGERFLLNLGEGYEWTAVPADQTILRRVPNVLTIRGSQGLYEAHAVGRTTLTVTGDPACRQSKPPCGAPSRLFRLQVVVQ